MIEVEFERFVALGVCFVELSLKESVAARTMSTFSTELFWREVARRVSRRLVSFTADAAVPGIGVNQ